MRQISVLAYIFMKIIRFSRTFLRNLLTNSDKFGGSSVEKKNKNKKPGGGQLIKSADSLFSEWIFMFRWHGTNSLEHDSCPSPPATELDANGDITSAIISAATGRDASIHPNVRSIGSRHSRGSAPYPYVAR